MSDRSPIRRIVAEVNFSDDAAVRFKIGNRSVHQFWHLFASQTRHVLLAPQRRPDSGRVAWTWREGEAGKTATGAELIEVRRRLSEASRQLTDDGLGGSDSQLDRQVHASVREMMAELLAMADPALAGFVCRAESGLMLHSWGAASPARPQSSDDKVGEVAGTVWVDGERAARVSVVIESAAGALVARASSDKAGDFRFQAVAPGNYNVRVADRTDFLGRGLPFTMERDAVTGLELRGGRSAPELTVNASRSEGTEARPRYGKWAAITVFVPAILGVAFCIWHPGGQHPADGTDISASQSGWQSASGKLTAAGDQAAANKSSRDAAEPAWSDLSHKISAPKALAGLHQPRLQSESTGESKQTAEALPADDSTQGQPPVPSAGTLTDPKSGGVKPTDRRPDDREAGSAGKSSGDSTPSEKDAGSEDVEKEFAAKKSGERSLGHSADARDRKPTVRGDAAQASGAPTTAPDAPVGSDPLQTVSTVSAPAGPGASSSMRSSSAASAANSGPAAAAADAPDASPEALSASPAAGSSSNLTQGHLGARGGAKRKEATSNLSAALGAKPVDALPDGSAPESAAPAPESIAAQTARSASPANASNAKAAATSASLPPDARDEKFFSGDDIPAADKTAAQAKPTAQSKSAAAQPQSRIATVASLEAAEAASDQAQPTLDGILPSPDLAKKSDPKKTSRRDPSAAPTDQATNPKENSSPVPETNGHNSSPVATSPGTATGLEVIGRVSASPWKARLMQDVIVPTLPLATDGEETLETVRNKLLEEQKTKIPAAFLRPATVAGLVFDFSGGDAQASDASVWRDGASDAPATGTVRANRAEIGWDAMKVPADHEYILSRPDGRELARVSTDQTGTLGVRAAQGVKVSYWVGIEDAQVGEPLAQAGASEPRFDWRFLSGIGLPRSWLRSDHWENGRGQRLEIPLERQSARTMILALALVDRRSGWALTSSVSVR